MYVNSTSIKHILLFCVENFIVFGAASQIRDTVEASWENVQKLITVLSYQMSTWHLKCSLRPKRRTRTDSMRTNSESENTQSQTQTTQTPQQSAETKESDKNNQSHSSLSPLGGGSVGTTTNFRYAHLKTNWWTEVCLFSFTLAVFNIFKPKNSYIVLFLPYFFFARYWAYLQSQPLLKSKSMSEKDDSITCSSAMAQDRNSQITAAVRGDCEKGEENPPINNSSSTSTLAAAELRGIWQKNVVGVE